MPNWFPDELAHENIFEEIGSHARPGPYDHVKHLACPDCGAPVGAYCVSSQTQKPRRLPCVARKEARE